MPPPLPRKSSRCEQNPPANSSTTPKRKPAPLGPSSGAKRQQSAQTNPGSGPSPSSSRRQINYFFGVAGLEDDDEHSAISGDILIASQQLQEASQDHHDEIGHRIANSPTTEITAEAAKHLTETPPESPNSVESPKLSPSSKKRQTELAGFELRTLLKNDKDLHKQIKELDGIRAWWADNRTQWLQHKKSLEEIEEDIISLRLLRAKHDDSHDIYTSQILLQQKKKDTAMIWFVRNRIQMKAMLQRFRNIQASDLSALEKQLRGLAKERERRFTKTSASTGSIFRYDDVSHISEVSSIFDPKIDIEWYFNQARKELALRLSYIDTSIALHEQKVKEAENIIIPFKNEELDLMGARSEDADLVVDRTVMRRKEKRDKDYEKKIWADIQLRKSEQTRDEVGRRKKRQEIRDVTSAIEHYGALNIMLEEQRSKSLLLEEFLEKAVRSLEARRLDAVSSVFDLLYRAGYQLHRQFKWFLSLEKAFGTEVKRTKIAEELRNYNKHIADLGGIPNVKVMSSNPEMELKTRLGHLTKCLTTERGVVEWHEASLRNIVSETTITEPIKPAKAEQVPETKYLLSVGTSDLRDMIPGWGSKKMTYGEAEDMLSATIIFGEVRKTWLDSLVLFFTSPDIWPLFYGKEKGWTETKFKENVNLIVKDPVPELILDAFVLWCSQNSQLFSIGYLSRRMYPTTMDGWETRKESRVEGPPRRHDQSSLEKPPYLTTIESILVRNRKQFERLLKDGKPVYKRDVHNFINSCIATNAKPTFAEFEEVIAYWTLVGTFYLDIDKPTTLLPIENGWSIPPETPFSPLIQEPTHFSALKKEVMSKNIGPLLSGPKMNVTTEEKLWGFFCDNRDPERKPAVSEKYWREHGLSKHKFHLFLRWCTVAPRLEDRLFEVHRDGTVILRSNHWDEKKLRRSESKERRPWERGLHSFERVKTNDSATSRTSTRSKTESFFKKILGGKK